MVRKIRDLMKDLRKAGFKKLKKRGKGSHSMWAHPAVPNVKVTLSGDEGEDADGNKEDHVAGAIAEVRRRLQ